MGKSTGCLAHRAVAPLPPGCSPLNEATLSTSDPSQFYEANSELSGIVPPRWTGTLRQEGALPTQHFATNQIKPGHSVMRLMPYSANMDSNGITYDAYTLDRWSDPERSDLMMQQTPSQVGAPWNKVTSVGTNMKQIIGGPDGYKTSIFTGKSGIRVGLVGSSEPVWKSFGDNYGNFLFSGSSGSSMEVPLVRGSPLLTHKFKSATPVLAPYCLSSVNGNSASFECPIEPNGADGGSGFLDGTCGSGELTIILRATKAVELSQVQWAANTAAGWPSDHGMNTCGSECTLSNEGKQVDIRVPGASGTMNFAVNVIGKFILPPDWVNNPMQRTCTFVKETTSNNSSFGVKHDAISPTAEQCDEQFCHDPSCTESNGQYNFRLVVKLSEAITGPEKIQFAVETASKWSTSTPMLSCTNTAITCVLSSDKKSVEFTKTFDEGDIRYAVNVIGRFIRPPTDWQTSPYSHTCGDVTPTTSPTSPPGSVIATGTKFIIALNEPGNKLPDQTRKFVAYFSEDMSATLDSNGLYFSPSAGGTFTGIMQLGYVGAGPSNDVTWINFLDPYQGFFPYKPDTKYCANGDKGYISFDWNKNDINGPTTSGQLLMITMPHQESLLTNQGTLIYTPFGYKGIVLDDWLLEEDLPEATMDPDPEAVQRIRDNPEALQNILTAIGRDTTGQDLPNVCINSNSYGVGKAISMVARLASISRAFGTDHYQTLDEQIRTCLEKWLRIDDTLGDGNKFRYDTVYGGIFSRNVDAGSPINPNANYGFPVFSDHHFHLGYFIYAMGYYAKYYPAWTSNYRELLVAVTRDVANPSKNDKYFPVVRHKDFYYGISWATGLVGGTRQAESSSEAIACYHGVAALGLALGDINMQNIGQLMLATEIRSVREYYHVRANNEHNFPPVIRGYGTIGQFAEGNIYLYTLNWPCDPFEFPMRHACLVGIQIIPITSIAKYYMDQEWALRVQNVCGWSINPTSAPGADQIDPSILRPVNIGWGAFCHSATSKASDAAKAAAVAYVKDLTPGQLVSGTGAASTLLFIYESS